MNLHPLSSGRQPVAVSARVAALLVAALVLGACSRSSQSEETTPPVASTIDISEPVVVIADGPVSDSDATLTVSEAVPSDGVQQTEDQYIVVDDIVTLPPSQVDDLLGTTGQTPNNVQTTTTTPSTAPTATGPTSKGPGSTTTTTSTEGSTGSADPSTTSPAGTNPAGTTPVSTAPDGKQPGDPDVIELAPVGPTDTGVSAPSTTPLQIVQSNPQGEVATAPYVTVTFNQPMAGAESADVNVPISIEPATAGSWRWLGDRTARFEPSDTPDGRLPRFAAATLFRVTVSGAIESASGQQLGDDVTWQFATPPPTVVGVAGASANQAEAPQVDSTAVFVVQADQHIAAEDVVAATTATVDGAVVEMRPATNAEIEEHPDAADAIGAAGAPRTAAITPVEPLPAAADVTLSIGPDLASLEGGLVQSKSVTFFARTRSTPAVVSNECVPADCSAGSSLSIVMNNGLDTSGQSRSNIADLITIEPNIANLEINIQGNRINLVGDTKADTEYAVTVGAGLRDVFGQTISDPIVVRFSIGDAHQFFDGPRSEMVILDPEAARATLAVQTVNHDRLRVAVWAVTTRDFSDYQALRSAGTQVASAEVPEPWLELFDDTIAVTGPANEVVTTQIDLDDELAQAGSQLVVFVAPDETDVPPEFAKQNRPLWTWVQRTALGVDAIADESTLMIWTTDLRTGKPVGGIPVALIGDSRVATTDEEGIQVIKLTDEPIAGLIANDGNTVTYLPAPGTEGWKISDATQESRWEVVLDGTVYRAGETVKMTGWVRGLDPRSDRLLITPNEETEVVYTVVDAAGNEIDAGTTTTNERGGFSAEIALPAETELGEAKIVLRSGTSSTTETLEVSQFLAPEFAVALQPTVTGPYLAQSRIDLSATATYTNRSPVTNAEAAWSVDIEATTYRPPRWTEYQFGRDPSSATTAATQNLPAAPGVGPEESLKQFSGLTDGTGSHAVTIDVDEADGYPSIVSAAATVTDDQNSSEAEYSILVHPAEQYVGLRTSELFSELGDPIVVDAVVTDLDGTARPGRPVEINLFQVISEWENGEWVRTLEASDVCEFDSTANPDEMRCSFEPDAGGEYLIRATVRDQTGRPSVTERTHWVSGTLALPSSPTQLEQATVVPDHDSYRPGDTARLLIGAPWAPARGVVVLSRYNIEETIPFETEDGSVIVEVPITDRSVPNVTGWVTMIGAAPRLDADGRPLPGETRPAVASGRINLSVSADAQTLDVTVAPATSALRPGQDSNITVTVTDRDGAPVADAQVALIVADEIKLAASGFRTGDPTEVFYADYPGQLSGISSRQYVQLLDTRRVDPNPEVAASEQGTGSSTAQERAAAEEAAAANEAVAEDRFSPLALYSTENFTAEDGSTVVPFRVPDRTAEYRISAVVIGPGQQFGFDESSVAAGQPLDVEPEPPALVRVGDQMLLPVVLRNHTDQPLQVAMAAEVTGAELTGPAGQAVTVPASSTVEVRWPIQATAAGEATVRIVAESTPVESSAVESDTSDSAPQPDLGTNSLRSDVLVSVPVAAPATAQTFSTNSTLEPSPTERTARQRVNLPSRLEGGFGGLRLTASTTVMAMLGTVADGSGDPTPVISNSARAYQINTAHSLSGQLELFGPDDPQTADAMTQNARRSFQLLTAAQRDDGAWSEWPREDGADAWVTVVAADAVISGLDEDWGAISEDSRTAMLSYVADINAHIPDSYPALSRALTQAMAVQVLRRAGGEDAKLASARADALFDELGPNLEPDALALIWPSVTTPERLEGVAELITDRAVVGDDGVRFAARYSPDDFAVDPSPARTNAIVFNALVAMSPDSELIQPTLDALLADRFSGTWGNRPANASAASALRSYSDRFEAAIDDDGKVAVRAGIDQTEVLSDELTGRATVAATIPLKELRSTDPAITLSYAGSTRLYLDSRLTFASAPGAAGSGPILDAVDRGIVVERSYEPILDPGDVNRQADGTWLIKRGAPVRVRLVIVTDSSRTNVALIDQLPAGLAPVSPSLAVAQSRLESNGTGGSNTGLTAGDYSKWPGWNWFDHQTLTDRSAEVVTASLGAGSYEYIYVARATTPGQFVAPPATANATYDPDVSGSSRSARVVVE